MKNIVLLLAIILIGLNVAYAETAVQETEVDASGIVLVVNKQPGDKVINQKVKITRCGLIAVININGKIDDKNKTDDK